MLSGCFPRFLASRIHCRRLVVLFSMVCVEGAGWAGVTLPDKVANFVGFCLFLSLPGRLTRGDTGVEVMPAKTCRQEWRHDTSGDARHAACRQPSCSMSLGATFLVATERAGAETAPSRSRLWVAAPGMYLPSAAGPGVFASGLACLSLDRQEGLFLADFPLAL